MIKPPGSDMITGKLLKELPRKGIVLTTTIFNAILRLSYWPKQLKFAQIIVLLKPGKPPNEVTSYRPISLLPVLSKILEKILLTRIHEDHNAEEWIPKHQFGFRHQHSTIQQCHRITDQINKALEEKKYCSALFLDISQAFDKVWHNGLLFKIKSTFSHSYYLLLKSYLNDRYSQVKYGSAKSTTFMIKSGVPQGSVLGPLLYLLYTADLPTTQETIIGTFADDTAIIACDKDPVAASDHIQRHIHLIENWIEKWQIKINENKSSHVTFTLRRQQCPPVTINNTAIPQLNEAKYLGMHMDRRLTWKTHILKKRKEMDLKVKQMYWLLGRRSLLAPENKILLYKTIIKPIWTYGIELWGCSSSSNVDILQRFQSKTLRAIIDAPWYVSNRTIHEDLKIPFIRDVIKERAVIHNRKLEMHPNEVIQPLMDNNCPRRLKRKWPRDLEV